MPTILYVEDDINLATVTTKSLTKRGFEVTHCSELSDAQNAAAKQRFDYALLDLKLENETSLELIAPLKKTNPDMAILVLTGYASIATAVRAIKLGADNYLSKPATISDILRAFDENRAQNPSGDYDNLDNDAVTMSVKRLEWEHIQRALTENNGNVSATARQLKMHRRTLQRKLQKKPVSE